MPFYIFLQLKDSGADQLDQDQCYDNLRVSANAFDTNLVKVRYYAPDPPPTPLRIIRSDAWNRSTLIIYR